MMQQSLQSSPPPVLRGPEVMSAARRQGDAAIAAGAAKATRIDPHFITAAGKHMLDYLRAHGVASGEILTDSCKLAGIAPANDKHFGAVIRSLLRNGLMHWAGPCKRSKGHASRGGSLYKLGPQP